MNQIISDVTAVSSKGQIVLPKQIRDRLNIVTGTKMFVLSDNENIILKPIREPDISEFRDLMDAAASWADEVGMNENDIQDAIKSVRDRKKTA